VNDRSHLAVVIAGGGSGPTVIDRYGDARVKYRYISLPAGSPRRVVHSRSSRRAT
jgi:hypothetical protein